MCQGLFVHDFGILFFINKYAVVENLFIVLQAHCDMNVKF